MKEHTTPRIEGLIQGHKADGRCVYNKAAKAALIEAYLQSDVSAAGCALANGINANLLRKWVRAYERETGKASNKPKAKRGRPAAATLIPIRLAESPKTTPVQMMIPPLPRSPSPIEIEYAGARVLLRGEINAQQLTVLLTCLARAA